MDSYARQLLCVRIIHSLPDMGTLGEELEAAFVRHLGRRRWEEYQALTERFWRAVRTSLERLALDYRLVDLYQDGLPVCGKESQIVRQAADLGSENFRLLQDLAAQGATLMGTEDPRLLLEERLRLSSALGGAGNSGTDTGFPASGSTLGPVLPGESGVCPRISTPAELLARRDAFIARQIGRTLQPGRTAILFLGMAHQVERFLPTDIIVSEVQLDV